MDSKKKYVYIIFMFILVSLTGILTTFFLSNTFFLNIELLNQTIPIRIAAVDAPEVISLTFFLGERSRQEIFFLTLNTIDKSIILILFIR